MADMPPRSAPTLHATHDLALVAAYAAGDAAGAELTTATTVVASCTHCADLHRDLRAIAAAMPSVAIPPRPRDFRLTPEQAAALRPGGWRRFVGIFAGPSFRLAAPLGSGLAALGLAGVLLGSMAGAPMFGVASNAQSAAGGAAMSLPEAQASPIPPNAAPGDVKAAPSAGASRAAVVAPTPPTGPEGAASNAPGTVAASSATPQSDAAGTPDRAPGTAAPGPASGSGLPAVTLLGVVALALGLLLVGLRLAGSRAAGSA